MDEEILSRLVPLAMSVWLGVALIVMPLLAIRSIKRLEARKHEEGG
jgi:hypothetical protein